MRALPNESWREVVRHYTTGKPGHGAAVRAYRAAGLGKGSTTLNQAREAYKLLHDERVIAAILEEGKKTLRAAVPEATHAALDILRDKKHKDRAKVALNFIERADPTVTRHDLHVVRKVIDPDEEALEELQALRRLGTTREKLLELYGANGLDRLEALEAVKNARRAEAAKVIDLQPIETAPLPPPLPSPDDEPDPDMLEEDS
jgi:hypothetical protein